MASAPGIGAFVQLAARGPQEDVFYDTGATNPFTASCTRRSTQFAIEQKDVVFAAGFQFDKTNRLIIPRRGDMLGDIMLEFTLPIIEGATINDFWLDDIGYILLKHIRFSVDDVELSREERLWYDLSDALFMQEAKRNGIYQMIGRGTPKRLTREHTIFVPLKLFCCKNHHLAQNFMPLLTAPGSHLMLEIESEAFLNCITSYGGTTPPTELPCKVLVDYVFLAGPEKERMINRPHTLLIETVQDAEGFSYKELISDSSGDLRIPTDSVVVDLSEVNFPVKSLVWVAYSTGDVAQKRFFQYEDIIKSASLQFDGVDRTAFEHSQFYENVQTYFHATRCIPDKVFFYSFALDASAFQPNGHCTFGEVSRPTLNVKLKEKRDDVVVKVFVLGYRFLEFYRGRVRIKFA